MAQSAKPAFPARPFTLSSPASSPNLSGYAVHSSTYTSVSASWAEPTGRCTSGAQYSSFWVGLDGYRSDTLESIGSEVDCSGSRPGYYSWYEVYPQNSAPVKFSNRVKPGDRFTGSVTYDGAGKFTLKLSDTTAGWTHTENKTLSSATRSSAEVIVSEPFSVSGMFPLADFGSVSFSGASVDGSHIGRLSPTEIIMKSGSTQKDKVSALTSGDHFSVTWLHR